MADLFDPSTATVADVKAHLETADADETARVIAAETAGKNRAGITGATTTVDTPCPICFPQGLGEYTAVGCEHTS